MKVFQEISEKVVEDAEATPSGSKMTDTLKGIIQRKIYLCFEEQKVYLDPQLTLTKLSVLVGTNTCYLSTVVNTVYGCNLPTLINRYRIGQAKRLIAEDNRNINIIYKMCGFNSRSVFYTAFQKEVGISPSKYVKQFNR